MGCLCSGHPIKITIAKRKRALEVMDTNPRLILQEITNVVDVELDHSMVDKILCNFDFYVKIPKKKPIWRFE